jgi:hypothetical protein
MVTSEQLEQLMFSKLNMILKRNYYTPEQQLLMKQMLLKDIETYLKLESDK